MKTTGSWSLKGRKKLMDNISWCQTLENTEGIRKEKWGGRKPGWKKLWMPPDRPFGCAGLATCPAAPSTLHPSVPWMRKRKELKKKKKESLGAKTSQSTQRIMLQGICQGAVEVTAVWTKHADRKKVHTGWASLVFCYPAMDKCRLC